MTTVAPVPAKPSTVRTLLLDKQQEILAALPKHITPAHFIRVVLTAVQRNPKLADRTPMSFLGAVLQCAQLGLVPDGFLGQAYLIPYENRKRKPPVLEVQFQCGYRGLITLARRSGEISNMGADVVYEKDQFKQIRGLSPSVDHVPFEGDGDPGALTYVYAWYRLKDGGYDLAVLNRRQVQALRERSQAYRTGMQYGRKDSPWFTDEAWMYKKTAIKQLLKLAPLSVDIQRAAGLDDAADAGLPQDLALLADPNAEATALLEGDSSDEEAAGNDIIAMPQRLSEQPAAAPADSSRAAQTAAQLVDRLVQVKQSGNGWAVCTEGGLRLWTRDPALGAQLVTAKLGELKITADPADAQGRRKLTKLEE